MTARTVLVSLPVTIVGTLCAVGAYWGLLIVPESNVLALLLSTLLILLTLLIVAWTTAAVLSVARGATFAASVTRAFGGLPGFMVGLIVFGVLWWSTTRIDALWALHRGEIDAMFLRYVGTARTQWVHATIAWVTWLLRWGVGLTAVGAATAGSLAAATRGGGALRGVRRAFSVLPLGATIVALLVGRALWSLAYWRPGSLPADNAELIFVSAKLGVLFVIGAALVVVVLHAIARETTRSTSGRAVTRRA